MKIARAFHVILNKFCHISGALITKTKSVVYGWNVESPVLLRITDSLGFPGFV